MWREVDRRQADGLDVRLMYDVDSGEVEVALSDTKSGECFAVPVRSDDRAMDVFHHPFAYAAINGMRLGSAFAMV